MSFILGNLTLTNILDKESLFSMQLLLQIKSLRQKREISLYIDQAARDTTGAINITESIEEKIKQCDVFIADISIINRGSKFRMTPNPNVMFELGLAAESVGWSNIILVLNKNYGNFDDLPFDIKIRRSIPFELKRVIGD